MAGRARIDVYWPCFPDVPAFGSSLIKVPRVARFEVADVPESFPHIVRWPCPKCLSARTVQTAKDLVKETLYCPECGHIWTVDVPPPMRS